MKFFKSFNSIAEASRELKVDTSCIIHCMKGTRVSSGGYYWVDRGHTPNVKIDKIILQYSLDGNYLNHFTTYGDILRLLNIKSPTSIKNCFQGIQYQAYGFKWRLLEGDELKEAKELGLSFTRLDK